MSVEPMVALQTSHLAPVLSVIRAALGTVDRSAFLPTAARDAADFLGAGACELWLDDDGPALTAAYRSTDAMARSPAVQAVHRALAGDVVHEGPWLLVPLPGENGPRGVLAALGTSVWEPVDDEKATVIAGVIGLAHAVVGAERFDSAARDQFLALLGHDLRSPLANVRVGAQLARRNLTAGDLVSVGEALEIIENQSGRLLARLEALLDAIAAAGHKLIRVESLDLVSLAESVVEPHRLAAEEAGSGTVFVVEPSDQPLVARGDQGQITQVIEQLVDNAAKYAAGGQVVVSVHPLGGQVRLEVCDNGPGIRPEDVERVFAPFGRGRGAGDKQGYGLGLYLARNIVTAHGGRLWIARTSRSGTCMAFTLPAAEPRGP